MLHSHCDASPPHRSSAPPSFCALADLVAASSVAVKPIQAWFKLTLDLACRYPTTVATLSRRARDRIEAAFEQSVEGGASNALLGSRLHDFGFRGCTCVEQSVIGGVAHLLNFDGSDTLSAAYYAQVRTRFLHQAAQFLA